MLLSDLTILFCQIRFAFVRILAISTLFFCLPMAAQERNAWQFDSLQCKVGRF